MQISYALMLLHLLYLTIDHYSNLKCKRLVHYRKSVTGLSLKVSFAIKRLHGTVIDIFKANFYFFVFT